MYIAILLDIKVNTMLHPHGFDNCDKCKVFQAKLKNGGFRGSARKSYVTKSRNKKSKMFDCDQVNQEVKTEASSESSLIQDLSKTEDADNNNHAVKTEAPSESSLLSEPSVAEEEEDQNTKFIFVPKTNEKILKKNEPSCETQQQQNDVGSRDPDWFTLNSQHISSWTPFWPSDGFGWISSQPPNGRLDGVFGGGIHRIDALKHRNNLVHPHFKVNNFII